MIDRMKSEDIPEVAKLYAEVFAGPPWNEYTRCYKGNYFGLDSKPGQLCNCCKSELVLAYPPASTEQYIMKEYQKPNAASFVNRRVDGIKAFVWGYSYETPEEFVEEKSRLLTMQINITSLLRKNGIDRKFFYYSECGVDQVYRGQGISNILAEKLVEVAKLAQLPLVMRTNWQSPMVAIARRFGMEQIMGPEALYDPSQKTVNTTGLLVNNLGDLEIPDRVLYVLR